MPPKAGFTARLRVDHVDAASVHVDTAMGGGGEGPEAGKCPRCSAKLEHDKGHECQGEAVRLDHAGQGGLELQGVEIFDVGTWNGHENRAQDLDDLVASFNEIGHLIKPRIKLGHTNEQKLLQEGGYPAAGWVTKLYRRGTKLLADIKGMPRVIHSLVKAGAYRRVSAEIYHDLKEEATGRTFRRVLDAVAFLGEEMPAVTTLQDIVALGYTSDQTPVASLGFSAGREPVVMLYEKEESHPMKTCSACKKPFGEDLKEFESSGKCEACAKRKDHTTDPNPAAATVTISREDYSKLLGRLEALETDSQANKANADRALAALALYERQDALEKTEGLVNQAIAEHRILPAQKDAALAVFQALEAAPKVVKYSKAGQEVEGSPREIFKTFLSSLPKGLHGRDVLANRDGVEVKVPDGVSEDSAILHERATRYAAENKVDYKTALVAIARSGM